MRLYQLFTNLLGSPDLIELFGGSGTQKSYIATQIAKELTKEEKKVLYIDTEKNLTNEIIDEFNKIGVKYIYTPIFEELFYLIDDLETNDYNWVILDSIGLPVLGEFATMNLQGRGNILLNMQSLAYKFKILSAKKKIYFFIINQPTSELGKTDYIVYQPKGWNRQYKFLDCPPMGDKMLYFFKECIMTFNIFQNNQKTITDIFVYRSRKFPKYTTLARLIRQNDEYKWEVYI